MTQTNLDSIKFSYSEEDRKLFNDEHKRHWKNIEDLYVKLRGKCSEKIEIPISATHRRWITQRVNLNVTTSLMRLLYLVESFCDASKNFNSVAAAVHIKAMTEIPLHLGYLVWILDSQKDFQSIRTKLYEITFGNKDPKIGLTASGKISQKTLYTRADEMINKFFKDDPEQINIFEMLYKWGNSIGHHNYEGRNILIGVMNDDTWEVRGRKTWFVFMSELFQLFMHCDSTLAMSWVFLDAIDHYLNQIPENMTCDQKVIAKEKFKEIQEMFKRLSSEMCEVVESYHIWATLVFSRSILEIGKEKAEKNVEIMGLYKDFFVTTERNHMHAFIVGISKFFDRDSRVLSIQQLIQKIKESEDIITADIFKEVCPNRFFPEDFKDGYKPIHDKDVKYIEELRKKHEPIIGNLKTIRDKQSVHNDMKVIKATFIPNEVVKLIEAIQEMFNKLSGRFESSTTVWHHLKDDAVRSTKFLLENLERGEVARMKEDKEKWGYT